jgi:hypothetical protein
VKVAGIITHRRGPARLHEDQPRPERKQRERHPPKKIRGSREQMGAKRIQSVNTHACNAGNAGEVSHNVLLFAAAYTLNGFLLSSSSSSEPGNSLMPRRREICGFTSADSGRQLELEIA